MDKMRVDFFENLKNMASTPEGENLNALAEELSEQLGQQNPAEVEAEDKTVILSRIFENSLSGGADEAKGVVYTDEILAGFMASKAVGEYIGDTSREDMLERIMGIRILDPSCGCGAFMLAFFRELLRLHREFAPEFQYEKACRWIFCNNLFAVDIDMRAVQITKLRAKIYTGLHDIEPSVCCADFLSGYSEKDFDIIAGNPPYIGEKGNKQLFDGVRKSEFGREYYEKGMDYFYYFIEKSIDLARQGGIMCFVTTSYWTMADYAVKLRDKISRNCRFRLVIDFNDFKLFSKAMGQHNMIFIIEKELAPKDFKHVSVITSKGKIQVLLSAIDAGDDHLFETNTCKSDFVRDENGMYLFMDPKVREITDKIRSGAEFLLGEISNINQGLVSGADKVSPRNMRLLKNAAGNGIADATEGEGIFVLRQHEVEKLGLNPACGIIKPFYKSPDIRRYATDENKTPESDKLYIIYTDKNTAIDDYPDVKRHLSKFRKVLEARREAKAGTIPWYSLHWPRNQGMFEGEKIISPQRAKRPTFGYNNCSWYASADIYYISDLKTDPRYILGVLNSKLMHFWLYYRGKRKGCYLELYQKPLSRIPINVAGEQAMHRICQYVEQLMKPGFSLENGESSEQIQNAVDKEVFSIYGMSEAEINFIESKLVCK